MISKQLVYIVEIELHVFGLEEYKNLPTGTPLCAMFFCTSAQCNYFKLNVKIKEKLKIGYISKKKKKATQEYVERACRQMCTLNEKRAPNDRYLIMISLDHPNAGTRAAYRDDSMQKLDAYDMAMMLKVYVNGKATAFNIISII
jgi:hypothetical protein